MKIIGLTGFKRSGKNTFAEVLKAEAERRGHTVRLVAYGDKLKIAAARALGFDRTDAELIELMDQFKESARITAHYHEPAEDYGDIEPNQHDLSGREYLQFFGTEAGRQVFGDTFWIDQVTPMSWATMTDMYPDVDLLIVTDVRFDNEALRITSPNLKGTVLEVRRHGFGGDGHASEAGVNPKLIAAEIDNNGHKSALLLQADAVLNDRGL